MKAPKLLAFALALFLPSLASAVTVGFLNDFEDTTAQGWGNGGAAPDPANLATGGPLGVSDNFLQINSDGAGGGGKLIVYNNSANWLGDYVSAGVTAIEMDLKNFSATPLTIRLAFRQSTGGSTTPGYSSTTGFTLPADGQWYHAIFPINAGSMTGVNSPSAFGTFMTNPGQMRILHATTPLLTGNNITATMGVDNIRAVPEPGVMSFLLLLGALRWQRRSRH